jgi:phage shock protein A
LPQFFNRIIKKIFEPAKDPNIGSDLSGIEHQLQLLHELDQALIEVHLAKKQLLQLSRKLEGRAFEVLIKAKKALGADREDLARIALRRRQTMLQEVKKIGQQITEVEQEAERLALVQQRLTARLEAYSTKRDVLSARQTAAEAQVAVGEAMGGITEGSEELNRALELAEINRGNVQARAEAIDELMRSGEAFAELDNQNDADVEKELESLKRERKRRDHGRNTS